MVEGSLDNTTLGKKYHPLVCCLTFSWVFYSDRRHAIKTVSKRMRQLDIPALDVTLLLTGAVGTTEIMFHFVVFNPLSCTDDNCVSLSRWSPLPLL